MFTTSDTLIFIIFLIAYMYFGYKYGIKAATIFCVLFSISWYAFDTLGLQFLVQIALTVTSTVLTTYCISVFKK